MNDTYVECLVRRKVPFYSYIVNAVMIFLTAVSVVLAFTTNILAVIVMFAVGFATYILYRNARVEFEYLYVDKIFSVDKIFGMSKRKKAWECGMDDVQIIAPSDSHALDDHQPANQKVLDFTSHLSGRKVYALVAQMESQSVKVLFEPNDKMLQCFRQTAPRKVVL